MKCENCGKPLDVSMNTVISVYENDVTRAFCKQCAARFSTCAMCQHNVPCGFFNDPDPMPQFKVITLQTRQGNTTYIEHRQVPNTERIKKFCTDGKCKCFLDDPEHPLCCRHGGYTTCTNYCELEKYKFVQDFFVGIASEN